MSYMSRWALAPAVLVLASSAVTLQQRIVEVLVGQTVRGTLAQGDRHQYEIRSARPGQRIVIRMTSSEFDPTLVVPRHERRGPGMRDSLSALRNDNESPESRNARVDVTFPPGPYGGVVVILASSAAPGQSGSYELTIADASTVQPVPGGVSTPVVEGGQRATRPPSSACRDSSVILPPASPRSGLTVAQALDQLRRVQERSVSRSEFETAAEFVTRQRRFIAEQRRDADAITAGEYGGSASVSARPYDADREIFPIHLTGPGINEDLELRVSRSEAPFVRANIHLASATGRFWLEEDGTAHLSGEATIRVGARRYPAASAQPIRILRSRTFAGQGSVALSPDGRWLATGPAGRTVDGGVATLWNVATGEAITTLSFEDPYETGLDVAFSPECRLVAVGGRGRFQAFSVPDGRPAFGVSAPVDVFAFSPDGRLLATGSSQIYYVPTIRLGYWSAATGQLVRALIQNQNNTERVGALAFSPDGRYLAVGTGDARGLGGTAPRVAIWDVSSGRLLKTLQGHDRPVTDVAFSPDGRTLASIDSRELRLWVIDSGQLLFSLQVLPVFPPSSGLGEIFSALKPRVAFSPDGLLLAVGGALLDARTGQVLRRDVVGWSDYEFSRDGQWVAGADRERVYLREIRRVPAARSHDGPPN